MAIVLGTQKDMLKKKLSDKEYTARCLALFVIFFNLLFKQDICKQFLTSILENCNRNKLSKKLLLFYGTIKY